jgi:hypothetical protein
MHMVEEDICRRPRGIELGVLVLARCCEFGGTDGV